MIPTTTPAALSEFCARLMAEAAPGLAALPVPAPVEPEPELEGWEPGYLELLAEIAAAKRGEAGDVGRVEPLCACGRIVSRCDGSRRGCGKTPRIESEAA